jgi:hypothetical protein
VGAIAAPDLDDCYNVNYPRRMFSERDLALPTADLACLLVERLGVQLDMEVRNGGFAQYFFNRTCPQAFDAWFAAESIVPVAHDLLGVALNRLGGEFSVNLDLANIIQFGGGKALGPAYGALLGIYKQQRNTGGALIDQFASFRDRLAAPRGAVEGFDSLNMRFFRETTVVTSMAEYLKESADDYLA